MDRYSPTASALAPRGASDTHWSPRCSLLGPRRSASGWRPPTAPRRTSTLVFATSAARAPATTCVQCRRPQRPGMQRRLRQQLHGCPPRRMSRCASKPNRLRPQLRLPSALRPPARRMLGPPGLVANVARREQMPAGLDLTRAARSAGDWTLSRACAHRGNARLSRRSLRSRRRRTRRHSASRCRWPRRQQHRRRRLSSTTPPVRTRTRATSRW